MRMGLFQLRYLDRIPQHAVVDTAVSIAKRIPKARDASGFVNAVMRRATRETAPLPVREKNEKSYLAIAYSHPRWMVERFVDWFGVENAERLMTANNDAAPNVIRLNLARGSRAEIIEKLTADGFEIGAPGRAPETIVLKRRAAIRVERVSRRPVPRAIRGVADGRAHARSARRRDGRRLCGGARWQDDASGGDGRRARSSDRRGPQFQRTQERARPGAPIAPSQYRIPLRRPDRCARRLRRRASSTCSSTRHAPESARLREHPEIKWRLKPTDPARMAAIQSRMLDNAAALVRRGGAIVYSVCSIAPEEGENVVDGFLARHDDFAIDSGIAGRDEFRDVIDARGFMKTRPDLGGLDGFFAARLIRR